jgi:nucleotide-binding universal stress UspA family protein
MAACRTVGDTGRTSTPQEDAMPSVTEHLLAAVADDVDDARVAHAARRLAAAAGLPLRVAHVAAVELATALDPLHAPSPMLGPGRAPVAYTAEMPEIAERRAREVLARVGVEDEEGEVLVGEPVGALLERMTDHRPWALVVGSHGRGVLRTAVLGSTSRALTRDAPCPIVAVPPGAGEPFAGGPLLCALERPGPRADVLLAAAATVGDRLDRTLVLVHVQPYGDGTRDVAADLEAARGLLGDRDVHTELLWGRPADELRVFAVKTHADAIIVATRGLRAMRTVLSGSVATELTAAAPCPVIVVPPPRRFERA